MLKLGGGLVHIALGFGAKCEPTSPSYEGLLSGLVLLKNAAPFLGAHPRLDPSPISSSSPSLTQLNSSWLEKQLLGYVDSPPP